MSTPGTSDFMNRFLRGQDQVAPQDTGTQEGEQKVVSPVAPGQGEKSSEELVRQIAGRADGGAGRDDQQDPPESDFLRAAYRQHRGF